MKKAIVADIKPCRIQLTKGKKYFFCTCGRSQKQPLCDGAHKATDLKPLLYTADKDQDAWFCACKQSGNIPFCDGSHKKLSEKDIGDRNRELSD